MYDQKLMDDVVMKIAWNCLLKNMVLYDDMLIDKKRCEILDL